MITINAKFSQEMQSLGLIGRVGENASRQIVFDCSEVLTEFSGASILCVLRRSKDEMPYTADVAMSGTNATLTLTDTDLAVAGYPRDCLQCLGSYCCRRYFWCAGYWIRLYPR